MVGNVRTIRSNLHFFLINIYGPSQNQDKRLVWTEIEQFLGTLQDQVCILSGDFNVILDPKEKLGGSVRLCTVAIDLKD